MIKKDTSVYLDYIKDTEAKVKNLCDGITSIAISDIHKQAIEKNRIKILAKTGALTQKASTEVGFIPNFQWNQFKKEVDGLYKQLSDSVNQAAACYNKTQNNMR